MTPTRRQNLIRGSSRLLAVLAALAMVVSTWTAATRADDKDHKHTHGSGPEHIHAPVPAGYAKQAPPADLWTDKAAITRGAAIYATKCAVCHGNEGAGD